MRCWARPTWRICLQSTPQRWHAPLQRPLAPRWTTHCDRCCLRSLLLPLRLLVPGRAPLTLPSLQLQQPLRRGAVLAAALTTFPLLCGALALLMSCWRRTSAGGASRRMHDGTHGGVGWTSWSGAKLHCHHLRCRIIPHHQVLGLMRRPGRRCDGMATMVMGAVVLLLPVAAMSSVTAVPLTLGMHQQETATTGMAGSAIVIVTGAIVSAIAIVTAGVMKGSGSASVNGTAVVSASVTTTASVRTASEVATGTAAGMSRGTTVSASATAPEHVVPSSEVL